MSKSLYEFKRFVGGKWASFSEYEKKLAKLILDNFAKVESAGSAAGNRGKLIAKLINDAGESASMELNIEVDTPTSEHGKVTRLSQIKVKNFRGFSNEQTLAFKNLYTFIYGPNGTGKSSLCEALEYGLLGSIHEADAKRIELASYIKNSITKKSDLPVLSGVTHDGKDVVVSADQKSYEFCFIEKNRIEGFARVAATTAQAQQTRLASLFGLEDFNLFCTQFNENFDKYLDCTGKKAKELADKEKQISGQKAILLQIPAKEADVKKRQDAILSLFLNYKTLDEIKEHISGGDSVDGLVKKNNAEIARLSSLKLVVDPGIETIATETNRLIQLLNEGREARRFVMAYKDQLSLGDLYSAILDNSERYQNKCPACESTLYENGALQVPLDPYQNASTKLIEFDLAIKKEARVSEISNLLRETWTPVSLKIANILPAARSIDFDRSGDIEALSNVAESVQDAKSLEAALNLTFEKLGLLASLKTAIETFNKNIEKTKSAVLKLEEQNRTLGKHLEEIVAISAIAKENATSVASANSVIEKFKAENEQLIAQVESEKPTISRNLKYNFAYESFREKLIHYNSNLPLSLAADLNEKTLKFYNAINRHDHESDRLTSVALPTSTGKKIEIEFEGGEKCDALQILSEGHIRCLGLAILLSKIVRDNLPFLIFDDVVNSIDDEHRSGIVELILGDDEIKNRQLIITTHGEDFVKRLENSVPKAVYAKTVSRIDFLVPIDSKKIVVKLDSPRHYLVIAEQSFVDGKARDCLSYVRKAFEELLNRLWKKIGSKSYTAQIQVAMRGPGGSPDLMSVARGLYGFLGKKEVTVFKDVVPLLETMLGMENRYPIEWSYLNKGTHEEDKSEEFDSVIVKDMLALVIEMDSVIEGKGAAVSLAASA
ncbi:AAA family ATPase [Paraburkholderia elongata]|uniref:AAA family ATPase n=1 Tax=Paraburkholderia elongata TaxID=2675747 RepID=A0A972SKZ5_9BURK|nr:AAA family ATPase [Paraburkholderia elongata]NPT58679.1 AAA family ATPase [Paraburkholderia elongata]